MLTAPGGVALAFTYFSQLEASQTLTTPHFTGSVAYAYDNTLWPITFTVGTEVIPYAYDLDGLLTQAGSLALHRQPATGWIEAVDLGRTHETVAAFTPFGEEQSVVATAQFPGTTVESLRWTRQCQYDAIGRVTEHTETRTTRASIAAPPASVSPVQRYTYDNLGRLAEVRDGNHALVTSYGYDANGNRTTSNGTVTGTADAQDRLLQSNGTPYAYRRKARLWLARRPSTTTTNSAT